MDLSFVAVVVGALGIVALGIVAIIALGRREMQASQFQYPFSTSPTFYPVSLSPVVEKETAPVTRTEEIRPTSPHIVNHNLNQANTWYEIRIPKDVRTWQMQARGDYDMYYSFEPSHSTYMTLASGAVLSESTAPNMSIRSIYVMSGTSGALVELEMWRNHG